MLRRSTRYVCLKAAAFLLCGVSAASEPASPRDADVTVYIDNPDQLPGEAVMALARRTAAEMFAGIGVTVAWAVAGRGDRPLAGVVLHLQIAHQSRPGVRETAMARAYPFAGGTAIVVQWKQVRAVLRNLPGLDASLLASVMVHEITHVLQGTNHHAGTGVMKASWTLDDCVKMYREPLPFTTADASLVHSGLARLRRLTKRESEGRDEVLATTP